MTEVRTESHSGCARGWAKEEQQLGRDNFASELFSFIAVTLKPRAETTL